VNGLKVEFPDQLKIVSVDVQSNLGRELTRDYGKFTPTFILFDVQGEEIWRSIGTINAYDVRNLLQ